MAAAGTSAQPAASSASKTVGVPVGKEGGGEREEEWGGSGEGVGGGCRPQEVDARVG